MAKVKTKVDLQKEIKDLQAELKARPEHSNVVRDCIITNTVTYDENISEAVLNVAAGLYNLTELFKSQNIDMTAIRIESETKEK